MVTVTTLRGGVSNFFDGNYNLFISLEPMPKFKILATFLLVEK